MLDTMKKTYRRRRMITGLHLDWYADERWEDDGESFSFDDLGEVICFLREDERVLLDMVRGGKTFVDIAKIAGTNDKRIMREVGRVVDMLRFYYKNMKHVRLLYGNRLPLNRKEILTLQMCIVHRRGYAEVSGYFNNLSKWATWRRVDLIRKKLFVTHPDFVRFMDEHLCRYRVRKEREQYRRLFMADEWREDLKRYLLNRIGNVWYVWGGQDLENGLVDCSGLVLEVLKMFGRLPKDVSDMSALGLSRLFGDVPGTEGHKIPIPGDLAFYGDNWRKVSHVMFFVGNVGKHKGCVVGMCGGKKDMTVETAKMLGAGLWVRTSAFYRRDFLGFRVVH